MFKGLQCIIGRFRTWVSRFEVFESDRERFTSVCFRILKHGDLVGNQRTVGLFPIISI